MDLDERKKRLKMFLECGFDKEMMCRLKVFHSAVNVIYQETGEVGMEDSKRLVLEHFPKMVNDSAGRKNISRVLNMILTFENITVELDGITMAESSNIVQEILESIE